MRRIPRPYLVGGLCLRLDRREPRPGGLGMTRLYETAPPLERLRPAGLVLSDGLFGQLGQLGLRLGE